MSRSLVRYVFPRFAFRLTVVVLAMAIGMYVFARAFRVQSGISQLQREALLVSLTIDIHLSIEDDSPVEHLDRLSDASGLQIGVYGQRSETLYASVPGLSAIIGDAIENATDDRPGIARPGDTGGRFLAVATAVDFPYWPEARVLAIASDLALMERTLASLGMSLTIMVVLVFMTVLLLSYRVVEAIKGPLRHLQLAASRFAEGDLDYRCLLPEPREFAWLADTMNSMASQLTTRIEAIRSQRAHLEAILGNMTEGVILLDGQYRIRSINAAARRLFGISGAESSRGVPRTLLEVVRNSEIYEVVGRTLREKSHQEASVSIYSNPPRYMQVNGTAVDLPDDTGVLVVFNDITRLQQLENIRRDFVANVSHELKTPITSILGFVETLTDGALEDADQSRRFLDIIAKQTQRLAQIVEDLLQLSRLEQNRGRIVVAETELADVIATVVDSVAGRAAEKGITVEQTHSGAPTAALNRHLVEQAVFNLVDNAVKYCPAGSRVEIACVHRGTAVEIAIRDNGPGVPADDQPRLFERFFRVDRARSRGLGGTGLGLAIVKHIAQAHGGGVTLESTLGAGSTFTLTIPQGDIVVASHARATAALHE